MKFEIEGPLLGTSSRCQPIINSLTEWFGIEEAVKKYLLEIENLPTYLARNNDVDLGFLCIKHHNPFSAELFIMGVRKEFHRQGIGRELVEKGENWLRSKGIEYIEVKTLGPSNNDPNYAKTRAFYSSIGFKPLEENLKIWNEQNPCMIFVKRI